MNCNFSFVQMDTRNTWKEIQIKSNSFIWCWTLKWVYSSTVLTSVHVYAFFRSCICSWMLTHVRVSAVRFLVKQQAGKIAPSFNCHLKKASHHSKVNGKSLWGIWATGVEFVQCHSGCYKRLQPKDNRRKQKKSLQVPANTLIMRSLIRKVQQCPCPHF